MSASLRKTIDTDIIATKQLKFKQGPSGYAPVGYVLAADGEGNAEFTNLAGLTTPPPAFTTIDVSNNRISAALGQTGLAIEGSGNIVVIANSTTRTITINSANDSFQQINVIGTDANGVQENRLLQANRTIYYGATATLPTMTMRGRNGINLYGDTATNTITCDGSISSYSHGLVRTINHTTGSTITIDCSYNYHNINVANGASITSYSMINPPYAQHSYELTLVYKYGSAPSASIQPPSSFTVGGTTTAVLAKTGSSYTLTRTPNSYEVVKLFYNGVVWLGRIEGSYM